MKLAQLALAAGIAVGSVSAFAGGGPLDLSTGSTFFGNTPPAGGFSDTFTFSLTSPSFLTSAISTVANGTQNIDFSFISLSGPSGLFSFAKVLGDPFELWTLNTGTLAAGAYALTLLGTNSSSIASYSGTVAVTAVPEPETAALLLAGVLAVGFVARRRSL